MGLAFSKLCGRLLAEICPSDPLAPLSLVTQTVCIFGVCDVRVAVEGDKILDLRHGSFC